MNALPLVQSTDKRADLGILTCGCCSGTYIHPDSVTGNLPHYNSGESRSTIFLAGMQHDSHSPVSRLNEMLRKQSLINLPPYSPNLNIIERLGKFFKKKVIYNSYYEIFTLFRKYCLGFFRHQRKYRAESQTLMTNNFQLIQAIFLQT